MPQHHPFHPRSPGRPDSLCRREPDSPSGYAIPPDAAGQIFVPFFTTKEEGSGIGLSLSKQIMRLSGGTLTLLPYKEKGQATVFVLVFN